MPNIKATSKFHSVNITENETPYYDMYPEDRWCLECGCVEPDPSSVEWVCECCQHNYRVDKFGVPDFESEYWMTSACDVGESLRRSYKNMYINSPDEEPEELGPWPINTDSLKFEKPEPIELLVIKNEKETPEQPTLIPMNPPNTPAFKWAEPQPLREMPVTPPPTTEPSKTGGKYVPPGKRRAAAAQRR